MDHLVDLSVFSVNKAFLAMIGISLGETWKCLEAELFLLGNKVLNPRRNKLYLTLTTALN